MRAGREGDDRGWNDWMASPTQWTWVWVSSGSWWWTGRPGVLHFVGSQRVRHHWATELNWNEKFRFLRAQDRIELGYFNTAHLFCIIHTIHNSFGVIIWIPPLIWLLKIFFCIYCFHCLPIFKIDELFYTVIVIVIVYYILPF